MNFAIYFTKIWFSPLALMDKNVTAASKSNHYITHKI